MDHSVLRVAVQPGSLEAAARQFPAAGYFTHHKSLLSAEGLAQCIEALESVLKREPNTEDSGVAPSSNVDVPITQATKLPRQHISTLDQNDKRRKQTMHAINVHRASSTLRELASSPAIGDLVCRCMQWPSTRLAQDQVWYKPAGAKPLSFHRDTTYFDMVPKEVCTVWIPFDDLSTPEKADKLGALQYCPGSHLWGDGRTGSANQFFDQDYTALLRDAGRRAGVLELMERQDSELGASIQERTAETARILKIDLVCVEAGGCSIHDGRTWHGSGANTATPPSVPSKKKPAPKHAADPSKLKGDTQGLRRGIGIHYVCGDARFAAGPLGSLWAPYRPPDALLADDGTAALPDEYFPVVWPVATS